MKYRLKWIEENLGITRSAIRYYEGKGLLPRNTYNQRREYSEEEVEGLWTIQILQGMLAKKLHELKRFLQKCPPDELEEVYDNLSGERKDLVVPIQMSVKEKVRQWQAENNLS